jgi:hypothetical protein
MPSRPDEAILLSAVGRFDLKEFVDGEAERN